ncbi:hypothetical protein [Burkholderia aenigmatica]|nr:hypothetical protein [Burkholderia aenigmatica]
MNGILRLAFKLLVNDSAKFTALTGYGTTSGRCQGGSSAQPSGP